MGKYTPFMNKQVVIVLRGETTFGFVTPEGKQVQTNCFFGYLVDVIGEDLLVSTDSSSVHNALINKSEVALISVAPENDQLTVEFTSDFEESDLN